MTDEQPIVFIVDDDPSMRATLADVMQATQVPGLWVVPAYKEMADLPLAIGARPDRARLLSRRLAAESDHDWVIFDAPPSLGLATLNVLAAADGPVLAYCRSGTRSCNLWALATAKGGGDPDSIEVAASGAGYDLSGVRPLLDALSGGD